MNPIRKKIKYAIPSHQYGGSSSFLEYFKGMVPKIKGYQGYADGQSNLYNNDSQDYYKGLINKNTAVGNEYQRGSGEYIGDWGDDAHNAQYFKEWSGRNPNATEAEIGRFNQYAAFEKEYGDLRNGLNNTVASITGDGINNNLDRQGIDKQDYVSWEKARDRMSDQAGREWKQNQESFTLANQQKTNQIAETGANIFSLMRGQEEYDNKPKDEMIVSNTGHSGYKYRMGGIIPHAQSGSRVKDLYNQFITNTGIDKLASTLPVTRKVAADNRTKKVYDKAGDQFIYDLNSAASKPDTLKKIKPILDYMGDKGIDDKLMKLDAKKIQAYRDQINKLGFISLGNIGDYKGIYADLKKTTGLTKDDAKGILDKALEKESWLKRNSIKAAVHPFLQKGGQVDSTTNSILDKLDIPQKLLMKQVMGKYNKPSEIMNGNEIGSKLIGKDNYGLVADLLLDPLNTIPFSKAKYLVGLKGDKFKKGLSLLQKTGNVGWGADKINDINTSYTNASNRSDSVGSWKFGGNINMTGFTPNTDSYNNDYNIIPDSNITMRDTPFPVLAKPNVGKPLMMYPGRDYQFPGASSVTEFPMRQHGGYSSYNDLVGIDDTNNIETASRIAQEMNQAAQGEQDALNQRNNSQNRQVWNPVAPLSGASNTQYNNIYANAFSKDTIDKASTASELRDIAARMKMSGLSSKPDIIDNTYLSKKGDPYEYMMDPSGMWKTRRRGGTKWIDVKNKDISDAITNEFEDNSDILISDNPFRKNTNRSSGKKSTNKVVNALNKSTSTAGSMNPFVIGLRNIFN